MRSICLVRLAVLLTVLAVAYAVTPRDRQQGMSQPHTVVSGSMAAAILGPHFRQPCGECQFPLICGVDTTDISQRVICPNCGKRQTWSPGLLPRRGDQAWLDTRAPLRRWRVFAYLNDDGLTEIKRLIGRPGERITFDEGDILIDGIRLQKTPPQFRDIRQLVHDDRFRSSSEIAPQRWRPEQVSAKNWQRTSNGWFFSGTAADDQSALRYHHYLTYESPLSRETPQLIQDDYPYNANISRPLHFVDDVMVEMDVTLSKATSLTWKFSTRAGDVMIEVDGSGRVNVRHGSQQQSWAIHLHRGAENLLVGICDRRVMWQWGGQWKTMELQWSNRREASVTPIDVTASGGPGTLTNLRVWRDVYYFRPPYLRQHQTLSRGQWFMLGDNVPVSVDGRHHKGGVEAVRFVGEVNIWPRSKRP